MIKDVPKLKPNSKLLQKKSPSSRSNHLLACLMHSLLLSQIHHVWNRNQCPFCWSHSRTGLRLRMAWGRKHRQKRLQAVEWQASSPLRPLMPLWTSKKFLSTNKPSNLHLKKVRKQGELTRKKRSKTRSPTLVRANNRSMSWRHQVRHPTWKSLPMVRATNQTMSWRHLVRHQIISSLRRPLRAKIPQ